jgi:hypothetical protein
MDQLVSPSATEWVSWLVRFSIPAATFAAIVLCLNAAQSGKHIFKCLLAPAIGLAGVFLIWISSEMADKFPKNASSLPLNIVRASVILTLLAALVCALLGLREYRHTPRHSSKRSGGRYAVVTALLCAFCLGAFLLSLYSKRVYGQANFVKAFLQPKLYRVVEAGFQIRPPADWMRVDGGKLTPKATLAFTQVQPPLSFAVLVQKQGPNFPKSIEEFVKLSQGQLRAANTSVKCNEAATSKDPSGATAIFESQVSQSVFNFYYVHRLVLTDGFAYQLVAWGPANDPVSVRTGSETMFSSFALLR